MPTVGAASKPHSKLYSLLHHEASGGVLLVAAAALALLLDNSPLSRIYDGLLDTPVVVRVGTLGIAKPLLLWINDGLMAIFFLLVGLEIKRELIEERLSSWQRASFPLFGAVGGMIVPALLYLALNWSDHEAHQGWAISSATDIAFALGVLALLGRRAPGALKLFLLALAIIDDLGAILIIAAFYTSQLSFISLGIAAGAALVLFALNRFHVKSIGPYALVGIVLWAAVLKSGVHATLAGVVIAFMIPLQGKDGEPSPAKRLEHNLHPWVMFGIVPLFAFANAGLSLGGLSLSQAISPVPLGIALGLFIGKQAGIFGFTFAGATFGLCRKPHGLTWTHIYGAAILGGIGFTMSLFIGTLAFEGPEHAALVRIGVLMGSILSAVAGYLVLRFVGKVSAREVEIAPAFTTAESDVTNERVT